MTKGKNMKLNYHFGLMSKREDEYYKRILLEEIDMQSWYAIAYSEILAQEVFLAIQ